MSTYEALYRKYRPRSFADLVGQGPISATLSNAIARDRLAHAYLFTGPRGTGKTSSARIFAKSLNCEQGPTVTPCDTCAACVAIRQGNFPDVIEIDAASHRGVDDARDLRERVRFAPTQGRYKVFIIDEVHMLTNEAFNALLKTIEEPPPNLVFILATTDVHKVLPTIVSRCQRFDFRRIPMGDLIARLKQVSSAEGFTVEEAGLEAVARRAEGGLRDALSLLDQVRAAASGPSITATQIYDTLGLVADESVLHLVGALADGRLVEAIEAMQGLLAGGFDHVAILRELTTCIRHLLLVGLAPDRPEVLDLSTTQVESLKGLAGRFSEPELLYALEVLRETEGMIKGSSQMTVWLEMALVRLSQRQAVPSIQDLLKRVAALEERLGSGPVPTAVARVPARSTAPAPAPEPPRAAPPAAAPAATPAEAAPSAPVGETPPAAPIHGDMLEAFTQVLYGVNRGVHSMVQQQGICMRREGDRLVLGIRNPVYLEMLEKRKDVLTKAAQKAFGDGTLLTLRLGGDEPPRPKLADGPVPSASSALLPAPLLEAPPRDPEPWTQEDAHDEPPIRLTGLASEPAVSAVVPAISVAQEPAPEGSRRRDDPLEIAADIFNGRIVEPLG